MKKFYYSLFAAATMLLATSCSQEEDFGQQSTNGLTTFSVSLDGATGSRAVGDGKTANKLYYEVYRGNELVIDKVASISTTATIEMSLLKGETYDIIFWAQAENGTIYQMDNLKNITIDYENADLKANQEAYDAFYNALNGFEADGKTHTIELRRPFAQLNLGTSDWNKVEDEIATKENGLKPVTHTSVTVKGLANKFYPLTGEAEGNETATFALSEIPGDDFTLETTSYKRLSLNYLLVPNTKAPQGLGEYEVESAEGKSNVDLTFALNRNEKGLFTIDVPNAPVQRNWRTNVVGDLLTGSKFNVVIEPDTDNDYNTLEILEEVLTKGGEVTLFSDAVLAEDITIPEGVTVKINLNEKTLNLDNYSIKVEGSLVIEDGEVSVNGQNSIGILLWNENSASSLEFNDVEINVTGGAAAIVPYQSTTTEITFRNSKLNGSQGLGGVYGAFWANDIKVNLYNSVILGKNGLYINAKNSEVLIDEKSSASEFKLTGGDMLVTYGGEKPSVDVTGSHTVTYRQMSTSEYEGFYQDAQNANQYYVTNAEGLLDLNTALTEITTNEGNVITIDLLADVDLEGQAFTPVDKMWVTFNGNNHTIKNMTTTSTRKAGLWAYAGGVTINNLTIENANVTGSQAGIFAGSGDGLTVNNCFLKGTNTVTWTATEETWNGIGAITGVLMSSNVNVTIVEGTTVTLNKTGFTTVDDCGYIDQLTGYISANNGSVTNNGTVTTIVNVSNDTELNTAITNAWAMGDATITLAAGTYSNNINLTVAELGEAKGDLVFKAAEGAEAIIAGTVTLGYRIQNVDCAMWNGNVTFEGVTFNHAEDDKHSIDVQDVKSLTLMDCKIIGDGEYGIGSARGNGTGTSKIEGCIFESAGMQLLGNFATNLVIDNCTFNESCINVQAGNGVTLQNCKFNNTLKSENENESFYLVRSNSTPITVKGCEIKIDSELTEVASSQTKWNILWNRGTTNWTVENVAVTMTEAALKQTELKVTACTSTGVINLNNLTVNGKVYASTDAQLTAAVKNGATDILLGKGTYGIPSVVDGKTITFNGMGNGTVFDFTKNYNVNGAAITFKNLYIEGKNANAMTGYGIQGTSKTIEYVNCTLNNAITNEYYGSVKYTECNFTGTYYITTYAVKSATFTDCTFDREDSRAVLVYSHNDNPVKVSLTGCTFKADAKGYTGAGAWTAAVEIDTTNIPTEGTEVTINGCTADSNYNGIVRDKSAAGKANAVITVDGNAYTQE